MLNIVTGSEYRDCEGLSRREVLRVGTLSLGGLTLAQLLSAKSQLATAEETQATRSGGFPAHVKDKAVVLLFLQGGPTHVETFDPKMTAPGEYRAMFGETSTRLPGVTFGHHFTRMARLADQLAVVRSFHHGNSSHASASQLVSSGGNPAQASLGSLYARLAGNNHPHTGMPSNVLANPAAVGSQYRKLATSSGRIAFSGSLGGAYQAFDPSAGGQVKKNMQLQISQGRLDDRRGLMQSLDGLRRQIEASDALASYDRFNQQAFEVLLGGVASAFDISQESPETLELYDTSHMKIPKDVLKRKRKNTQRFHPIALGKQMLLARRLCEAGCGFVTVSSGGWDMHGNALGIDDGMPVLGPAVDKAVSGFLQDVRRRGLSDKILLVVTGEFGRTPKINKKLGRDHWGNLCPLVLAGGGIETGQVIGESDARVSIPASDPIRPDQLMATIMHTLFDVGTLRVVRGLPVDAVRAIDQAQPIPGLL